MREFTVQARRVYCVVASPYAGDVVVGAADCLAGVGDVALHVRPDGRAAALLVRQLSDVTGMVPSCLPLATTLVRSWSSPGNALAFSEPDAPLSVSLL